jgi:hypothetical protein
MFDKKNRNKVGVRENLDCTTTNKILQNELMARTSKLQATNAYECLQRIPFPLKCLPPAVQKQGTKEKR